MSEPSDRDRLDVVERLDRRRSALVVEHRELAEDVAGAEVGERDRAAVGVLAHRARVAAAHDVARVARVALAEDDLSGGEAPRDRDVGDAPQVVGPSASKHGHPASRPAMSSALAIAARA